MCKIFSRFWLVKTTRINHHSQLLLTKFGKNFVILNRWRQNDVKSAVWWRVIEPSTEKTWGQGWVVLVVRTKWRTVAEHFSRFTAKYCLLFRVNFPTWADFNVLNFPIKMHYRYELTSTEVSMFKLFFLNLEIFWNNNKTIIKLP